SPYDPFKESNSRGIQLNKLINTKRLITKDAYREYKIYLAIVNGKIKDFTPEIDDIRDHYDKKYEEYALEYTYDEYLDIINDAIIDYEENINLLDVVDDSFLDIARVVYRYLDNLTTPLNKCPSFDD